MLLSHHATQLPCHPATCRTASEYVEYPCHDCRSGTALASHPRRTKGIQRSDPAWSTGYLLAPPTRTPSLRSFLCTHHARRTTRHLRWLDRCNSALPRHFLQPLCDECRAHGDGVRGRSRFHHPSSAIKRSWNTAISTLDMVTVRILGASGAFCLHIGIPLFHDSIHVPVSTQYRQTSIYTRTCTYTAVAATVHMCRNSLISVLPLGSTATDAANYTRNAANGALQGFVMYTDPLAEATQYHHQQQQSAV